MKHAPRFLAAVAATLLTLCACDDSRTNATYTVSSSGNSVDHGEAVSSTLTLKQYTWDGWGIATKQVSGDAAQSLIDLLENAERTGEKAAKISNAKIVIDEYSHPDIPAERGTIWIEAEGNIYRVKPDYSQLCLAESHLGVGTVLSFTEQCRKELQDAWYCWPYDCWDGVYENGVLEMTHRYSANTDVTATVKNMHITDDYDPQNSMCIELVSSVDQALDVSLTCQQSEDNRADGDFRKLELEAGKAQTIELSFGGFKNCVYWVTVYAGNTKLSITVHPS